MEPCKKEGEIQTAIENAKSAHHRLDEHKERMDRLEEGNKILYKMSENISVIAEQNKHQNIKIDEIAKTQADQGKEIKEIREKPLRDANKLKWVIIASIVSISMTAIFMSLPTIISNLSG